MSSFTDICLLNLAPVAMIPLHLITGDVLQQFGLWNFASEQNSSSYTLGNLDIIHVIGGLVYLILFRPEVDNKKTIFSVFILYLCLMCDITYKTRMTGNKCDIQVLICSWRTASTQHQRKPPKSNRNSPERMRTELLALIGRPSFSQVMEGRGMPEASQLRATGFFTTTLTFSGKCTWPIILGGTEQGEWE